MLKITIIVFLHFVFVSTGFQALQKNVNVVTSFGNVAFRITDPHPNNHHLTGTATLFSTHGERIKDIKMDFRLISHRHAPLGRDLFAKGYSCYRWDAILPDNITILEYWCRVQRNKATADLSRLEFNLTYHLVSAEVTSHNYNATSTAWFSRNRMGTTKDNIAAAGLVDSTPSTTDKSLPVTSNPSTVCTFVTITLIYIHWLRRLD